MEITLKLSAGPNTDYPALAEAIKTLRAVASGGFAQGGILANNNPAATDVSIDGASGVEISPPADDAAAKKAEKAARAKAKREAKKAAAAAQTEESDPLADMFSENPPAEETPPATLDDVKKAAAAFLTKNGQAELLKIIQSGDFLTAAQRDKPALANVNAKHYPALLEMLQV